jgi:hypothetical protein
MDNNRVFKRTESTKKRLIGGPILDPDQPLSANSGTQMIHPIQKTFYFFSSTHNDNAYYVMTTALQCINS